MSSTDNSQNETYSVIEDVPDEVKFYWEKGDNRAGITVTVDTEMINRRARVAELDRLLGSQDEPNQ